MNLSITSLNSKLFSTILNQYNNVQTEKVFSDRRLDRGTIFDGSRDAFSLIDSYNRLESQTRGSYKSLENIDEGIHFLNMMEEDLNFVKDRVAENDVLVKDAVNNYIAGDVALDDIQRQVNENIQLIETRSYKRINGEFVYRHRQQGTQNRTNDIDRHALNIHVGASASATYNFNTASFRNNTGSSAYNRGISLELDISGAAGSFAYNPDGGVIRDYFFDLEAPNEALYINGPQANDFADRDDAIRVSENAVNQVDRMLNQIRYMKEDLNDQASHLQDEITRMESLSSKYFSIDEATEVSKNISLDLEADSLMSLLSQANANANAVFALIPSTGNNLYSSNSNFTGAYDFRDSLGGKV